MSHVRVYKLIRRFNEEMEDRGASPLPGLVNRTYFEKHLFEGERDFDVGDKG